MKKLITVLISCSLTLAASAIAQQPEEQQKPKKERAENSPASTEASPAQQQQQQGGRKEHAGKGRGKQRAAAEANASPNASASTEANANAPEAGKQGKQGRQGRKGRNARAAAESGTANTQASPAGANAQPSPGVAGQANTANTRANAGKGQRKKLDSQAVQQIKTQHANFRAQPKPDKVPAVTFNQNYRIQGAEQWQGPQYVVFRSYHPEWHDQGWYRSHFGRVELIGGGYYYWNNGYWYPAWGYDPGAQYYAYDGPIYVGHRAEPPDQVIADVQAALQQQGYYRGEVDGLLGPLTREALTAYQADNGLYTTAAIDEPTLDALGMG